MAKGGKREGSGRPKGAVNKTTLEFKEAVNKLIEFATPQMIDWLERIAEDNPDKALDHVYKFAQFGYPLLARTEIDQKNRHVDKDGNDILAEDLKILKDSGII